MANVLSKDKQVTIIGALTEGSSMRSISRMTGVHGDTICRLGVRIGQGCAKLLDAKMRDLRCNYDMDLVSTSHIERLNGTTRLHMKRLARLTYAFSKKLENFEAATALHFAYYNFVKRHNTLRCTPAMAAGITRDFWSVSDLIEAAS